MRKVLALAIVAGLLLVAACDTADTTKPTVTFAYPTNGATVGVGSVTIKVVATDNKEVAKVEFFDGATKIGEDGTANADTFDVSWTATAGAHTLKAVASDAADNAGEASITVTVGGSAGPTEHTKDIVGGDSIWYPSGNPHIVMNYIDIDQNGKLTIMPGCLVKFATGAGFRVGQGTPGELQAVGTADSIITFTSNNATPNPGDWKGFDFYDQTRSSTKLSYCDINYGCYPSYAAVNIEGDQTIGIDHTTIRNSSNWGIWFGDKDGYVTGFTGNTITACASYPIYGYPDKLSQLAGGNTLTGNGNNQIYLRSGTVAETGTWVNQGVPYFIDGSLTIGGSGGAYLTIAKGTTVQLGSDGHITVGNSVSGGLIADSVTFTSSASSPQKGDWEGIWFYSSSTDAQCRLTRCDIGYGGENYGMIWVDDAVPTITGCNIHDSKTWGIELQGSEYPDPDSLLAQNTFSGNNSGDVRRP